MYSYLTFRIQGDIPARMQRIRLSERWAARAKLTRWLLHGWENGAMVVLAGAQQGIPITHPLASFERLLGSFPHSRCCCGLFTNQPLKNAWSKTFIGSRIPCLCRGALPVPLAFTHTGSHMAVSRCHLKRLPLSNKCVPIYV